MAEPSKPRLPISLNTATVEQGRQAARWRHEIAVRNSDEHGKLRPPDWELWSSAVRRPDFEMSGAELFSPNRDLMYRSKQLPYSAICRPRPQHRWHVKAERLAVSKLTMCSPATPQ
jgi:hypothetical protein